MQNEDRQEISDTLKLLIHNNTKCQDMSGKKIYGNIQKVEKKNITGMTYQLSNETGHGEITVYRVFTGIELYYNDMHMEYCNQNQATVKNMIEINHCYQMYQAYSIYIMSYGQYYLLTVVCGFIASMLAAVVSMLVAAKMHTISVAVCIPFFLYCLLPFIGRALSGYTTLFNLIPTILTNVQASVKVLLIYQIGNCVFRQIPLVMVMYTVMAIALLPFIYKSFRRYGNK